MGSQDSHSPKRFRTFRRFLDRETGLLSLSQLVVIVLMLLASTKLEAQVSTAVLLGMVQDPSGAAIVGAQVKLVSITSGISMSTTTNDVGGYVFPQVAVGQYALDVTMAGFRRYERTGIVLNVNQKARVDVTLEIGEVTESVNVAADASLVNTVDGEVGQTVVQKNIVDLPLKGRQFLELAFLTPGAVDVPGDVRNTFQGIAPAVNGNRPEHNNYTLNGATNRQFHNGFFGVVPPVDSVEEFKIQSGSFNAEFGQAGGAIVNVVTKSGTNSFHGSIYEFLRNDKLNARNFFNPARNAVKQNQFGATVGGPVIKNRTFFFFNYEGFRERRASTRSSRFPTPSELNGTFATAVRDPLTGQNFPGNTIPQDRIDPIARRFVSYFPATQTGLGGSINYINNKPLTLDRNSYGVRIDHKVSDKDSLSGVLNWDTNNGFTPSTIPDGPGEVGEDTKNRMLNLTYTRIFTPRVINEFRASYLRFDLFRPDLFKGPDYPTQLGLTGITSDPSIRNRFPAISFGQGYAGLLRSVDQGWVDNVYQAQDNLSWVKTSHSLKFGVGYYSPRNTSTFISDGPVGFSFSGRFSGNAVADFLLGHADNSTTFLQGGVKHVNQNQVSFYAQDQWQVNSSFTVNFGIRYEYHSPFLDPLQEAGSVNTSTGALLITSNTNIAAFEKIFPYPIERLSRRTFYTAKTCCIGPIMPRFGFALQLPQSMVLRGGYAVSQSTEVGNALNGALAPPAWIRTSLAETIFPGIGFNTNRASLSNIFPVGIQPIETNWKPGYTQSWNLTVEKQFGSGGLFAIGYVGSKGTHLSSLTFWNEAPAAAGSVNLRRPYPQFTTPTLFGSFGGSNYHALQAKAERRFGNGLGYLMGYTYAKGLGNASTVNEARQLSSDPRTGRGRLAFDVRQRFTAAVIYELPFGKDKRFLNRATGWVNGILGGWQINTVTAIQTGYPINLGVSPCLLNGLGNRCVPNVFGENHGNLPRGERNVSRWFNTTAFSAPAQFTQGNQQQFTLDGPRGLNNWDTSFVKNTRLREGMNLQFRAEFFNLFNHTRFAAVDMTLGSSTFGRVNASTGEREIQFALKLYF